MPKRTAASEIKRPIPQNRAIETNWYESDFLETSSDFEIGVETRMAVGMSGSKTFAFNSPPNEGSWQVQQRFNARIENAKIQPMTSIGSRRNHTLNLSDKALTGFADLKNGTRVPPPHLRRRKAHARQNQTPGWPNTNATVSASRPMPVKRIVGSSGRSPAFCDETADEVSNAMKRDMFEFQCVRYPTRTEVAASVAMVRCLRAVSHTRA